MKIKIKECIAKLELDLDKFKKELKINLDLEKSVNKNLKIIMVNQGMDMNVIKQYTYLGFDWCGLIKIINDIKKNKIQFKLHNVIFDGYKTMLPFHITEDVRDIELKEQEFKGGVIIIQDAILHPNFAINNLLMNTIFNYGPDNKYKLKINLATAGRK